MSGVTSNECIPAPIRDKLTVIFHAMPWLKFIVVDHSEQLDHTALGTLLLIQGD